MNLWLEQSAKAAHCARTMSRIAIQYAREGDPMMAFAKRREAHWWLRKARDYRAMADLHQQGAIRTAAEMLGAER